MVTCHPGPVAESRRSCIPYPFRSGAMVRAKPKSFSSRNAQEWPHVARFLNRVNALFTSLQTHLAGYRNHGGVLNSDSGEGEEGGEESDEGDGGWAALGLLLGLVLCAFVIVLWPKWNQRPACNSKWLSFQSEAVPADPDFWRDPVNVSHLTVYDPRLFVYRNAAFHCKSHGSGIPSRWVSFSDSISFTGREIAFCRDDFRLILRGYGKVDGKFNHILSWGSIPHYFDRRSPVIDGQNRKDSDASNVLIQPFLDFKEYPSAFRVDHGLGIQESSFSGILGPLGLAFQLPQGNQSNTNAQYSNDGQNPVRNICRGQQFLPWIAGRLGVGILFFFGGFLLGAGCQNAWLSRLGLCLAPLGFLILVAPVPWDLGPCPSSACQEQGKYRQTFQHDGENVSQISILCGFVSPSIFYSWTPSRIGASAALSQGCREFLRPRLRY